MPLRRRMQGTNRIVFNTVVLYGKIIIGMVLSLWTVPLVLGALGKSDYGLYNLVAGVVALLAFLNGAMTIATQRFLSVARGSGDGARVQAIFTISIFIHLAIALVVVLLVELLAPLLFSSFLQIPLARLATAQRLLDMMVVSMAITIVMVPLDAVLNAYEDLVTYSIIGVADSALRLTAALLLSFAAGDRVLVYGAAIVIITAGICATKGIYVHRRYQHLRLRRHHLRDRALVYALCSFAGWNTISSLAIVVRSQGLALVLNHFFGTVVNAAYGIGIQVNGVLGYFSTTIQKSITPQLMQSAGAADERRFTTLVCALGRYSTLAMGLVAVPLLVAMPYILHLWLPVVPEGTVSITRLIIVLSLVYQLSSGLMAAIQATGRLRAYTATVGTTIIATIPLAYAVLHYGAPTEEALAMAIGIESVCLAIRLAYAQHLAKIAAAHYLRTVVAPVAAVITIVALLLTAVGALADDGIRRLIIIVVVDILVYPAIVYTAMLGDNERQYVRQIIRRLIPHHRNNR